MFIDYLMSEIQRKRVVLHFLSGCLNVPKLIPIRAKVDCIHKGVHDKIAEDLRMLRAGIREVSEACKRAAAKADLDAEVPSLGSRNELAFASTVRFIAPPMVSPSFSATRVHQNVIRTLWP